MPRLQRISPYYPAVSDALIGPNLRCQKSCGFRCTKRAHDHAARLAERVAQRTGAGWKPELNHNMGWHPSAVSPCGRLQVHIYERENKLFYSAELHYPGKIGSNYWGSSHRSPRAAARKAVVAAKSMRTWLGGLLEGL